MHRFSGTLIALWLSATSIGWAQTEYLIKLDAQKLRTIRKLEREAIATNNRLLLGKAYYLFGDLYNLGGSNSTSKSYYLKAIRTLSPLGDCYELGFAYLRLCEGLYLSGQSREDIQYTQTAIRIFQRLHNAKGLANAYNHLTSAYKSRWVWNNEGLSHFKQDKAQADTINYCISQIERFGRQANDTCMLAEANLQHGDLYRRLKDRKAIPYLKSALHLFTQCKNDTSVVHAWCHLATAYMVFGQRHDAYAALSHAQNIATTKGIKEFWMATHLNEAYTEYYIQTHRWQQAFYNQGAWFTMHQYRLAGENDGTISRLRLEAEADLKEMHYKNQQHELALRAQNLQTQQRFTIIISILLLITAGLSLIFFRLYRKNKRISWRNAELVKEQNHRVKNNLQVVSSLLNLQAKRLTDERAKRAVNESRLRIQSMAIIHRRLYDDDRLAEVNLDEFIQELVEGVLKTYGYAWVEPHFCIDPIYLPTEKAVPIGLIINELTTNVCKYAFPAAPVPAFSITSHLSDNKLRITVTDNGPGIDIDPPQHNSFGMALIQAQVEQLYGSYQFSAVHSSVGNRAGFIKSDVLSSEAAGTVFSMEFSV